MVCGNNALFMYTSATRNHYAYNNTLGGGREHYILIIFIVFQLIILLKAYILYYIFQKSRIFL